MADQSSDAPLTPAVFHVLLALAGEPLHGYAIMKKVEEDSGLSMGPGTIYGSLQRLQDAGWVMETERDSEDARRGKTFALTGNGRSALRSEAERLGRLARLTEARTLAPESGTVA